jgi:hypothetical protein
MASPSKYLQAPEQPGDAERAWVLTWGQVLFFAVWLGLCTLHWHSNAGPPGGWFPIAYLFPAALAGLAFDFLLGRKLGLRNLLRID